MVVKNMSHFFLGIVLSSLMMSCGDTPVKTGIETKLITYFNELKKLNQFNGVVLVKKKGKTVLRDAYNVIGDDRYSTFVTPESQADMHDLSQFLAKATVIMLETDDVMHRSDSLSHFIPDFPRGNEITIQHLLDHRAGIPNELRDFAGTPANLLPHELIELIKQDTLQFSPGTDSLYSEIGYEIIYYLIAQVTKKPFAQYISEDVFRELLMDGSGAHFYIHTKEVAEQEIAKKEEELAELAALGIPVEPLSDEEKRKSYVIPMAKKLRSYLQNNTLRDSMIVPVPNYTSSEFMQARFYTCVDDLALLTKFLSQKSYRPLFGQETPCIDIVSKGQGIQLHLYHDIKKKETIILLGNFDAAPFESIKQNMIKILAGKKYQLPKGKLANGVAID